MNLSLKRERINQQRLLYLCSTGLDELPRNDNMVKKKRKGNPIARG
jgi:hypothetical protein